MLSMTIGYLGVTFINIALGNASGNYLVACSIMLSILIGLALFARYKQNRYLNNAYDEANNIFMIFDNASSSSNDSQIIDTTSREA